MIYIMNPFLNNTTSGKIKVNEISANVFGEIDVGQQRTDVYSA